MNHRASVGLDVRARSVAASALDRLTGEVVSRSFPYDPGAVADWVLSLEGPARCVYESGPTGFDLQRQLEGLRSSGWPSAPTSASRGAAPT